MSSFSCSHAAIASGAMRPGRRCGFGPRAGLAQPVAALQRVVPPALVVALDPADHAGGEAQIEGSRQSGSASGGKPPASSAPVRRRRRARNGQAGLAHADQRWVDRLVRAALRPERQARRRSDEQEARILVAGVIERIEAARDEGIVDRADREQPRPERSAASPSAASIRNRLLSAMPSSICWPACCPPISAPMGSSPPGTRPPVPARRNRPRWLTQAPRLVETVTSGEVVTMRSASGPSLGEVEQDAAERGLGRLLLPAGAGSCGHRDSAARRRSVARAPAPNASTKCLERRRGIVAEPRPGLPLFPRGECPGSRSPSIWDGFIRPA